MKYQMRIQGTCEEVFQALAVHLAQEYEIAKGKKLNLEELHKGYTFSKDVSNPKGKGNRLATIKLLAYDFPHEYAMEYKSSMYHKISSISMKQISEDQVELVVSVMEEKLKDGIVVKTKGSEDVLKKAPFFLKRQFQTMVKKYRKEHRKENPIRE